VSDVLIEAAGSMAMQNVEKELVRV
jgi:hypothetical protein